MEFSFTGDKILVWKGIKLRISTPVESSCHKTTKRKFVLILGHYKWHQGKIGGGSRAANFLTLEKKSGKIKPFSNVVKRNFPC